MGSQKDSRKQERETNRQSHRARAIEKKEITSTEFPEGGNTIYTKRPPPRLLNGGLFSLQTVISKVNFQFWPNTN